MQCGGFSAATARTRSAIIISLRLIDMDDFINSLTLIHGKKRLT